MSLTTVRFMCGYINRMVFTGVTDREILATPVTLLAQAVLSWQHLLRVLVSELLFGEL